MRSAARTGLMVKHLAALICGVVVSGAVAAGEANVYFVGDFESGRVEPVGSKHDGFYLGTLPNPQVGDEMLVSGQSDFGPDAKADTHVVRSEAVGGEIVRPRKGQFFLRSELFRNKNYLRLNGFSRNKPRSKISMSNASLEVDFDQEGYVGFSIFVPQNFEDELGVRDQRGESALFIMNADSARTLVHLGVWVQKPQTEAHWFLRYWTSATTTQESGAESRVVDLGPVRTDTGKWTDFVVRYRFNPFAVATNPAEKGIANAKNQMYQPNKGILQVWKAVGSVDPDGNRTMELMVDQVDKPIGLVPNNIQRIQHTWRIYKYGWLVNATSLTRPVWFGFDEIRQGLVDRDGTTFADVAPSGHAEACKGNCEPGANHKPAPPSDVAVD